MAATLQLEKKRERQGRRSPGQVPTKTLLETKGFVNPIDDDEVMTGYPDSAIKYADKSRGKPPTFFKSGNHFAEWMNEKGVNVRNSGETIFWTEPLSDAEIVIVANIDFQH